MQPRLRLENLSGFDTGDLRRFMEAGMRAYGVPSLDVLIVAAPARSRGCADVCRYRDCKARFVIAIAPPSKFRIRRLALLFRHEAAHRLGYAHEEMPEAVLYSTGQTPAWARRIRIRYRGRAPDQLPLLVDGRARRSYPRGDR